MPATALIIAILIGVAAGAAVFGGLFFLLRASMTRRVEVERDIPTSNVRIDDIWQTWRRGGLAPAAAFADASPPRGLDDEALAGVRRDLLKTEKKILGQPRPLVALRREIMDSIDRRMLQLETLALPPESRTELVGRIGDEFDIRRGLAADHLRIRLLRYYGAAKFNDRAENDWYDIYQQAAQLKRRGFRDFLKKPADNKRYQSAIVVGERLKQRLLETPPGTSFRGSGRSPTDVERMGR
jgi:hypothetical protein